MINFQLSYVLMVTTLTSLIENLRYCLNMSTCFYHKKESQTVWPHLLLSQHELGIFKLLHIAEFCLAIPHSNAESESLFSFMWQIFSKDRQSMDIKTIENILQLSSSALRSGHWIISFRVPWWNCKKRETLVLNNYFQETSKNRFNKIRARGTWRLSSRSRWYSTVRYVRQSRMVKHWH